MKPCVAVLGCGVIGSSWVKAFGAVGYRVRLWDPDPDAARAAAAGDADMVMLDDPADAVSGAAFIQENGPEDLAAKRMLYSRITDALGQRAIIASSSSTFMPSELQEGLDFAPRLLIGHPFNPPHILPLVEVVGGSATAEWAVEETMRFYAELGKRPIRLLKERPGHLANRLQAALWREAIDAVACGQASIADVDDAVALALGPRWALMGPYATFGLGGGDVGLEHFLTHIGRMFERLWDDAHRPEMTVELQHKLVREFQAAFGKEALDRLRKRRDERLPAILSLAAA